MSDWPATGTPAEEGLPLRGLRVLDLTRVLAGPFAAMVLGDLGADVIKVERPGSGDDTRQWGPPFHDGEATYFLSINRNRRSITLDLSSERGHEVVGRLAGAAHLVLENFLPHQLMALGLTEVRDGHPDVAWVSIRAASSAGPLGSRAGFDAMVQARSGLMSITGTDHATKVGVAIADVIAGLHAAVAALALLAAKGTFAPQKAAASVVEVPLLECALSALVNQAANYLLAGVVPQRLGNEHPNLAPYGSFACADGDLVVGAGTDLQFSALADVVGLPDDPRFTTNADRVANRATLNGLLAAALATEPRAVWGSRFDAAGVPWGPVNDLAQALTEEHVKAIEFVGEIDGLRQLRTPFVIDGVRPEVRGAPPALGEHTDEILRHLGYEVAELRAAGTA